ncbi:MAG: ATP-binding protein [Candidatus Aminicenantes bacterium]|nr:ATP-binding protein [Candidatus Aminicenantes bacterium]
MKRDVLDYLKEWKTDPKKKPILLRGARQVGKSWLAREAGKEFENFVEINFEKNPELCSFFAGNLDPERITNNLSNYLRQKIMPGKTLLFFDEIQSCPRAILALRYFYEDYPQLHVISAGSLLEFELRKISFPVGRVQFIYVYPLSFAEYLTAAGKHNLREMLLENNFEPLPEALHNQLNREMRNYTLIGGMPEVAANFLEHGELAKCLNIQTGLIETYRSDFHKYARRHQVKYIRKVFEAVPVQLGNKFKYANVSRDIKSRELGDALEMLEMAGIVYKVYHSSANGIPLRAEMDEKKFKVLFVDVGLAQRLLKADHKPLLLDPDISRINDGAIAELLTGLELIAYQNFREKPGIYYWHREARASNAEIDYAASMGGRIVPIEVKSGSKGKMRSLQVFMESKKSRFGVKVSGFNFSFFENVLTVPFYGLEALMKRADGVRAAHPAHDEQA